MTKSQIKALFKEYVQTEKSTIYTAYRKPSIDKLIAYDDCIKYEQSMDGEYGTVMNPGIQHFSYAFITNKYGRLRFVYMTKKFIYIYEPMLDDLMIKVR